MCVCAVLEVRAAVTCFDFSPVFGMGHIARVSLVSTPRPKVATCAHVVRALTLFDDHAELLRVQP